MIMEHTTLISPFLSYCFKQIISLLFFPKPQYSEDFCLLRKKKLIARDIPFPSRYETTSNQTIKSLFISKHAYCELQT